MKLIYRCLLVLHIVVGMGAMAGGLGAILNPWEPLGAPVSLLKNSPFENFFIPGIILFTVIGLGNIASAVNMKLFPDLQGYVSSVAGLALAVWIVVQCIMIAAIDILHILFFVIGFIQLVLSFILLFKQKRFPAHLVLDLFKDVKG